MRRFGVVINSPSYQRSLLAAWAMGKGKTSKVLSKANTTSSNSFSALIDASEDAGAEVTSTSRSSPSVQVAGRLQDPLVWIDLEMTGGHMFLTVSAKCHYNIISLVKYTCVIYGSLAYVFPELKSCHELTMHVCCMTWISGLNIDKDTIIEVACIVTDGSLVNQIEVRYLLSHLAGIRASPSSHP